MTHCLAVHDTLLDTENNPQTLYISRRLLGKKETWGSRKWFVGRRRQCGENQGVTTVRNSSVHICLVLLYQTAGLTFNNKLIISHKDSVDSLDHFSLKFN